MEIRFARESDIPGMIALLQQVGQVHHEIRPDLFRDGAQKYDEKELLALLQEETRPILIADIEGMVAGYAFCILHTVRGDGALCDRKSLYIDDLCVDEHIRGQGVATALYTKVLEFAKELGCHAVTLNVWCGNDRAMAFYEKCGLRPQKIGMEKILC